MWRGRQGRSRNLHSQTKCLDEHYIFKLRSTRFAIAEGADWEKTTSPEMRLELPSILIVASQARYTRF